MSDMKPQSESELSTVPVARPLDRSAIGGAWRPASPLALPGLTRRDAALDLALVLLIALAIPLGLEVVAGAMVNQPMTLDPDMAPLLALYKWGDGLLVVSLAAYLIWRGRVPAAGLGLRCNGLGWQLLWAPLTLVGIYAVLMVTVLYVGALVVLFPELMRDVEERKDLMRMLLRTNWVQSVVLMVPVAIHEEMLFRGLLIPYLRRLGAGWPAAVLISTAVFAVLHITQGWLGVVQVFGVGLVLGTCFVLSRSLVAVTIAHFLFDLAQLELARHFYPWVERLTPGG